MTTSHGHSMTTYDAVGILGAVLILYGLYRTVSGRWTQKSHWYELDHFIGSVLMIIYLIEEKEYVGIVINAAYGFVVFRGLSSYAERRAFHSKKKKRR